MRTRMFKHSLTSMETSLDHKIIKNLFCYNHGVEKTVDLVFPETPFDMRIHYGSSGREQCATILYKQNAEI